MAVINAITAANGVYKATSDWRANHHFSTISIYIKNMLTF
jgi:hypothetical protein